MTKTRWLMKNALISPPGECRILCNAGNKMRLALLAMAAVLMLTTGVRAANLLVNPGFEANSGHVIPSGWTRFAPPTAQVYGNYATEGIVTNQAGSTHYKEWGACYNGTNNAAGIYQDLGSAPGSTYQASGWFFSDIGDGGGLGPNCYVWIEVSFLGSSSNLLALFKSDNYSASVGLNDWFQYQVNHACDISSPVSIGDPFFNTYAITGSVTQLVAPAGTTKARYKFVYVQAASEGGSCFFDSAVLNQVTGSLPPVISNFFPQNMIFVNPNDGLSFNVSSPSGYTINTSGIHVTLNNTDVSASLSITGSSSNKNVSYSGLQSNLVYNGSISVTDSSNLTATANTYFETTWVGVPPVAYFWEAEDFDFTNGLYINNPALCSSSGNPTCYYGKVGVEGVDEHITGTAPNHFYRPDDAIGILPSGDYARKDHYLAGVADYRIDPFNGINGGDSSWMNYTRDWPAGSYWVVARVTADIGNLGIITLSKVNPGPTTTDLGTFTLNGGLGYGTFLNVMLKDTNGNNAVVTLNGKATLRATSGGNLLPGFFMLVAGQIDLPTLSNLYPTGSRPFEYTNSLSFTLTTVGATFPPNSITVNLDGNDVSPNLVLTGSTSVKNVVYPSLQPNAIHVAIIAATNSLGHGIRITNRFDTFSESNYMVDSEDYDYNGGQYFDPAFPNAYIGQGATTNIDFQHTTLAGEQFTYRTDGIPEDKLGQHDYLRQAFLDVGAIDYVLTFFAGGDWANYTRNYPAGSYYVYGRFSGGGPFTMYLDKVTSGAGTVNQVTSRLGQWSAVGKDYVTFDWVPLTDSGQVPVAIRLNGLSTLRITTAGFCNPNFIMLVPATGISLTASQSGNNIVISFPTQAGANYRVFYRNDLVAGNWVLLTSVLGNGSVKSVTDPSTGSRRFYKVESP
jgi:hypothetical protein